MQISGAWSRTAKISLLVIGSGVLVASCRPDILRSGNEPIDGMLGLIGLFAVGTVMISCLLAKQKPNEVARVWACLGFEYVTLGAILGGSWLIAARYTFFAEAPSGGDIFSAQTILLVAFAGIALSSTLARLALVPPVTQRKAQPLLPVSGTTWAFFAMFLLLLVRLNVVEHAEQITVQGRMQVMLYSRGLPLPAIQRVETVALEGDSASAVTVPTTVALPEGAILQFSNGVTTVVRNHHQPTQIDSSSVSFPNQTAVDFAPDGIMVTLPGRATLKLDPGSRRAAFNSGGMCWRDAGMKVVNALFALFLALILASSFERLRRCQPVSANKVVATLMLGFCLARLSQSNAVASLF